MNRREWAIAAGAVAPGVLLLALMFGGGGHDAPSDPPLPIIVHQIPAQPLPTGPARVVDA